MGRKVSTKIILIIIVIFLASFLITNVKATCIGTPLGDCTSINPQNCSQVATCQNITYSTVDGNIEPCVWPPSQCGTGFSEKCCTGYQDVCEGTITSCTAQSDAACTLINGCGIDCAALDYNQCTASPECIPQGTTHIISSQEPGCYPCVSEPPQCDPDIQIDAPVFTHTFECCEASMCACQPVGAELARTFYAYNVTCLSDYSCNPECTEGTQLCTINGNDICVDTTSTASACGPDCTPCATDQICSNSVCVNSCGGDGITGKVSSDGTELCYDNNSLLRNPNPNWDLRNALTDAFIIYPVNYTNQGVSQADFVSNSEQWYYCNASNTVPNTFGGIAVPEYGTFDLPSEYINGQVSCSYILSLLTGITFTDGCDDANPQPCCTAGSTVPTDELYRCFENDNCRGGVTVQQFCTDNPNYCGGVDVGSNVIVEFLRKENCEDPISGCLGDAVYDPDFPCDTLQQLGPDVTNLKYTLCNYGQVCNHGVIVNTSSDNLGECCFGDADSQCITIPQSYSDCLLHGKEFSWDTEMCAPSEFMIMNWAVDPPSACCYGYVMPKISTFSSGAKPESFRCFNFDGKNVFSECGENGYDVYNSYLIPNLFPIYSGSRTRVSSLGATMYVFNNFDKFNTSGTNGFDDDYSRITISSEGQSTTVPLIYSSFPNLTHFSYLEFDISFSNDQFNTTFVSNNGNIPIDIFNYMASVETLRWHHVIIPLKELGVSRISSIKFTSTASGVVFSLDNFLFTPDSSDLQYTSEPQYCTGSFRQWIDDLDPDINIYPWNSQFYTLWNESGPYSTTCNYYFAFHWTGHQCCGDDTRIYAGGVRNYGEFYNDTSGGCFNGTNVPDDSTVSYVKGYLEFRPDQFESYPFKDLLYINNSFLGCQVPNGKYNDLNISYNGSTQSGLYNQGDPLFDQNNNVMTQCAISGSYYCFNNAWRQTVNANNYLGDWKTEGLSFKSIPAGGELINNGNFGG